MNKRIYFPQLGGAPITQYTFDYMQKAYGEMMSGLAAAFSDKSIVSGCDVGGNSISDGWVCIAGELLPFKGGGVVINALTMVVVIETKEQRTFENNEVKDMYFNRYAQIGTPAGGTPMFWKDFRRIDMDPWKTGDVKDIIVTPAYLADNFDAAGIGKNERKGWALLDGQGGRVDARGRVSVGYNPTDTGFDSPGETGGSNTQIIQKANLPAVQIDVPIPANATSQDTANDGRIVMGNGAPDAHPGPRLKTATLGSGTPLSIVQSYFVTAKIIKL